MSIQEFFLNIICSVVGIYIAEDIVIPYFGYYNKRIVNNIVEIIVNERYKGKFNLSI